VVAADVLASSTTQTSRIMCQAKRARKLLPPSFTRQYPRCA